MLYVTDFAQPGCRCFDDVATEHASPEAAAIAYASYIENEVSEGDERIEKWLADDDVGIDEYLVCGEDGKGWIVELTTRPERFDLTREKGHRVVWAFDVHAVRPSDEKFRWHVFTEEEAAYGEAGPGVHHFCEGDPCVECVEQDKADALA